MPFNKSPVLENQFSSIDKVRELIDISIHEIDRYLENTFNLFSEFNTHETIRDNPDELNIFRLVSEIYHRENFHSDVIVALLNYKNEKDERPLLKLFLDYLNSLSDRKITNDYSDCDIRREKGKIDISLLNEKDENKHAIIFENKINGAPDMPRQIPRYVELIEKNGYEIEAVVYLVLNNTKTPSTLDWSNKEEDKILPLVYGIKAVDDSADSLIKGWLEKALRKVPETSEVYFVIKQYTSLLNHLSKNTMNKELMEKFLQHVLVEDNFNNAIAVKDMLNDLIIYRKNKILEKYKNRKAPFTRVLDWNNFAVIDSLKYKGGDLAIDVIVEQSCYRLQFFDRIYVNSAEPQKLFNIASVLLAEIGITDFTAEGLRMQKVFLFPAEENKLYSFIDEFIQKIAVVVDKEKNA